MCMYSSLYVLMRKLPPHTSELGSGKIKAGFSVRVLGPGLLGKCFSEGCFYGE